MHLPLLVRQARDLTLDHATSAHPHAPVRRASAAAAPARHRSPGVARRVVAGALRRSADRLAPVIE